MDFGKINKMNQSYDEIEEELKEEAESKKKTHKVSGRSVFELKRIIKEKSKDEQKKENRNSK